MVSANRSAREWRAIVYLIHYVAKALCGFAYLQLDDSIIFCLATELHINSDSGEDEDEGFRRESYERLERQTFWRRMELGEKLSWLRYRNQISMNFEDRETWESWERGEMYRQDPVEHSSEDARCILGSACGFYSEELATVLEMSFLWGYLGGGPRVAARLEIPLPTTPTRHVKRRVSDLGD